MIFTRWPHFFTYVFTGQSCFLIPFYFLSFYAFSFLFILALFYGKRLPGVWVFKAGHAAHLHGLLKRKENDPVFLTNNSLSVGDLDTRALPLGLNPGSDGPVEDLHPLGEDNPDHQHFNHPAF